MGRACAQSSKRMSPASGSTSSSFGRSMNAISFGLSLSTARPAGEVTSSRRSSEGRVCAPAQADTPATQTSRAAGSHQAAHRRASFNCTASDCPHQTKGDRVMLIVGAGSAGRADRVAGRPAPAWRAASRRHDNRSVAVVIIPPLLARLVIAAMPKGLGLMPKKPPKPPLSRGI